VGFEMETFPPFLPVLLSPGITTTITATIAVMMVVVRNVKTKVIPVIIGQLEPSHNH
jgi:hypothetical protein